MYSRMNTLHARSRLCVPPPKPASRLLLPTPPDLLRPSATSPRWPSLAQAHGGVPKDYPARSRWRPEDDGTRGPDGDRSTGSWIWPARQPARSVGGSSARSRRPRSSAVSPRRAGRASPRAHHFGRQRFASSPSKTLICLSPRMGCKMGHRFGCSVGPRLLLRKTLYTTHFEYGVRYWRQS